MHKGSVFSFIRKLASCESLWLILLKILVINRVQGKQVVELIKNENIDWGTQKFRWWGAGSISQERLEKAIQLPASALTNSFIENVVGRRVGSKQASIGWTNELLYANSSPHRCMLPSRAARIRFIWVALRSFCSPARRSLESFYRCTISLPPTAPTTASYTS